MIIFDKCNGSCNVVDESSSKMCVRSETKHINVKTLVFNMITKINDAKMLVKHISCDCLYKFNSTSP